MKLLDWKVSPDTPDSDMQVLHSIGVEKQRVPSEFPRFQETWRAVKDGTTGLREPALCCGQGTWLSLCVSWLSVC